MEWGDVTWHHGWTLHSSPSQPPNSSPRVALAISYFADGARVRHMEKMDLHNDGHDLKERESYEDWLVDLSPGDVADHALLPIVHSWRHSNEKKSVKAEKSLCKFGISRYHIFICTVWKTELKQSEKSEVDVEVFPTSRLMVATVLKQLCRKVPPRRRVECKVVTDCSIGSPAHAKNSFLAFWFTPSTWNLVMDGCRSVFRVIFFYSVAQLQGQRRNFVGSYQVLVDVKMSVWSYIQNWSLCPLPKAGDI